MTTKYEQLLLFEVPFDEKIRNLMAECRASNIRTHKAQFGKIGAQNKRIDELEKRLDAIERGLCQSGKSALHEKIEFFEEAYQ
jgi:hypothetical protein